MPILKESCRFSATFFGRRRAAKATFSDRTSIPRMCRGNGPECERETGAVSLELPHQHQQEDQCAPGAASLRARRTSETSSAPPVHQHTQSASGLRHKTSETSSTTSDTPPCPSASATPTATPSTSATRTVAHRPSDTSSSGSMASSSAAPCARCASTRRRTRCTTLAATAAARSPCTR